MKENDFSQSIADNERLVLSSLQNQELGPLDYDEMTADAVKDRCIKRFGPVFGTIYFRVLIFSIPQRHEDLFPELFDNQELF